MMEGEQVLLFRVKSLNNQIIRLMDRTAIAGNEANLTGMQHGILCFLASQQNVRDIFQRDIEAQFNIRRSTATGMLQLLERDGYIQRVGVPADARLKKIVMVEKAERTVKKSHRSMLQIQQKLTRDIPQEDLEQFCRIIDKMMQNAKD